MAVHFLTGEGYCEAPDKSGVLYFTVAGTPSAKPVTVVLTSDQFQASPKVVDITAKLVNPDENKITETVPMKNPLTEVVTVDLILKENGNGVHTTQLIGS